MTQNKSKPNETPTPAPPAKKTKTCRVCGYFPHLTNCGLLQLSE